MPSIHKSLLGPYNNTRVEVGDVVIDLLMADLADLAKYEKVGIVTKIKKEAKKSDSALVKWIGYSRLTDPDEAIAMENKEKIKNSDPEWIKTIHLDVLKKAINE